MNKYREGAYCPEHKVFEEEYPYNIMKPLSCRQLVQARVNAKWVEKIAQEVIKKYE